MRPDWASFPSIPVPLYLATSRAQVTGHCRRRGMGGDGAPPGPRLPPPSSWCPSLAIVFETSWGPGRTGVEWKATMLGDVVFMHIPKIRLERRGRNEA